LIQVDREIIEQDLAVQTLFDWSFYISLHVRFWLKAGIRVRDQFLLYKWWVWKDSNLRPRDYESKCIHQWPKLATLYNNTYSRLART